MSQNKQNDILAKIQDIIWPIKKSELKLFIPMSLMMLCVLFNFGALRSIKDSLVVPNIGAESISFLKLWLVLPSTIIFTLIYVNLSNLFDYEKLFYIIVSFFLVIFFLFTYVLYPGQENFHPSPELTQSLIAEFPNMKWFLMIASKWSYAIMYIFGELWSAVVINLLFWQYANHIFDTRSAKRFYPILSMVGNVGLIIAGNFLVTFSTIPDDMVASYSTDIQFQCECVLKPMMRSIIISGIIAMCLYGYIERYVLKDSSNKASFQPHTGETKTKLTVLDSLKLIAHSKYLGHIVFLILAYGLLINILEGPWKARVRELYPNTVDYMNFMGKFNIYMGMSCVVFTIIGSNILRHFSWLAAALVTPIMIAITGFIFFTFVIFAQDLRFLYQDFDPIYFAVIVGAVQNILSKSSKYSLFDSTKEMAYIPLPLELRTKGKAAVEVIGLKFGKSLGAFIQSSMFILMPVASFDSVTHYLMVFFVIVVLFWIWNVKVLNREYQALVSTE